MAARKAEREAYNAMNTLQEIEFYIKTGKPLQIKTLIPLALSEGYTAERIIEDALLPAMSKVSTLFTNNEMFVPEVLEGARAMNVGLSLVKLHMTRTGFEKLGTVVIGTVKGDLHNIGKNMVKMMLESHGFQVMDLGVDVTPARFIETAISSGARIICCSCLISCAMPNMQEVVRLRNQAGLNGRVVVMVGGAPVTQSFCDKIGADCYAPNAAEAADAAFRIAHSG